MAKAISFKGFYCKRCGGRVMENEVYTEVDPNTRRKQKKVELTCILCARDYRCLYEDYVKLLENIERVIIQKRIAKGRKKSLLSLQ